MTEGRRLPTFLIIGAGRSGTTSLARYLGSHPHVFMARAKELHFFDSDSKTLEWYRAQFAEARRQTAVGEATPNYLYEPAAIKRMAAIVPEARLIAILRDPVDRAYSHYWQNRSLGKETMTFEEALADEPRRMSLSPAGGGDAPAYLDRGRYLRRLRTVTELFPRESLLVVIFEEMVAQPVATYAAVCRFIGVDDSIVPGTIGRQINGYTRFRSRTLRRIARDLPPALRPVKRIVGRLNAKNGSIYPRLPPDLDLRLHEEMRDENAALAGWLGRDLSVWDDAGRRPSSTVS